jgi:hypothetical protein
MLGIKHWACRDLDKLKSTRTAWRASVSIVTQIRNPSTKDCTFLLTWVHVTSVDPGQKLQQLPTGLRQLIMGNVTE